MVVADEVEQQSAEQGRDGNAGHLRESCDAVRASPVLMHSPRSGAL
jgi:hypothetical protein